MTVKCVNPGFYEPTNLANLGVQLVPFAIMTVGMTLVVLVREIDVSIGSLAGVVSAVLGLAATQDHWNLGTGMAVALAIATGTLVGVVNGCLVALMRLPSIIVTLAMMAVLKGAGQILLDGKWVSSLPLDLRAIAAGGVPIWVALAVMAGAYAMLTLHPWGWRLRAVGSHPEAAAKVGLPLRRLKILSFTLMGFLTAVATVVSVPQLSVVESGFGSGWELFVITCVVLGGVSISGGKGTLFGALLGVAVMGTMRSVLVYLKLGDQAVYWERAIQGGLILVAAVADRIIALRKSQVTARETV